MSRFHLMEHFMPLTLGSEVDEVDDSWRTNTDTQRRSRNEGTEGGSVVGGVMECSGSGAVSTVDRNGRGKVCKEFEVSSSNSPSLVGQLDCRLLHRFRRGRKHG